MSRHFSMRGFDPDVDGWSLPQFDLFQDEVCSDEFLQGLVDRSPLDIKISQASIEYFSSQVKAFRRIDDLEGGSKENLKQIGTAIRQVATIVAKGESADPEVLQTMVNLLAQLAQIAGWMAFDAERHGLAQRYFRLGLQAAHNVGDRALGTHILACMAYQAAHKNQLREAAELAMTATRAAQSTHPLVRTIAAVRVAHMHAVAGDLYGFRSATAEAADLFGQAKSDGGGPDYLYWFDSTMAQTVEGQGILLLTIKTSHDAERQLDEAERLLTSETSSDSDLRPRDASFHGAWLARAHVKQGDLHRGLNVAKTALDRMGAVSSPRTRKVLRNLDCDLASLRLNRHLPEVRELREQLQSALVGA
jgi:hypothetical protein